MRAEYKTLGVNEAYRLIGPGPLVLVSSRSKKGMYDIAAIAWNCPLNDAPTRVIIVVDKNHQTAANIRAAKEFIVCVPHASQKKLVMETGSVSGGTVDKFSRFKIDAFAGRRVDALVPRGCVGYIECTLLKTVRTEFADVFIGECVGAAALKRAFRKRVLSEKREGKTLHHVSGDVFALPADEVI
jgi:flavin reductase (DIM6/NTAB) family NADH-FMN oxidoreductase RutF